MIASTVEKCPLTDQDINLNLNPNPIYFYYESKKTGKIIFSDLAFPAASELPQDEKQILTGICRNRTIKGEEPIMITISF